MCIEAPNLHTNVSDKVSMVNSNFLTDQDSGIQVALPAGLARTLLQPCLGRPPVFRKSENTFGEENTSQPSQCQSRTTGKPAVFLGAEGL